MPWSRRAKRVGARLAVALAPALTPFAIVAVAPRWESLAVAAVLAAIVAPGALVAGAVVPREHPLAHPVARPAVALVAALVPAAVAALIGTRLHWRLDGVIALWAVAAVPLAIAAAIRIARTPIATASVAIAGVDPQPMAVDRRRAAIALVGFTLVFAGIAYANQLTDTSGFAMLRIGWWDGFTLGATSSRWIAGIAIASIGAIAIAAALWRGLAPLPSGGRGRWVSWLIAGVLVGYTMAIAYRMPPDRTQLFAPWNLDDTSYVAEAIDDAAGVPLATEEPSLSLPVEGRRATVSVLGAPVAAAIARCTGVSPAALHHALLPPLLVLFGASALAAALLVLLRRHPQAVPLGLAAALALILKSWDYPGVLSEYLLYETAQPKSVHLWLVQPLQLATLLLVIRAASPLHAGAAAAVAVVGHAVHPFATVVGAVWCAVAVVVAVAAHRRAAAAALVALLAIHGGLALELRTGEGPQSEIATDRVSGEPRESRDLVRDDGEPTHHQDPRLLFAGNVGFALACAAIAIAVALARRRSERAELGFVAAISAAGLAACTLEPAGRVLAIALHPSILWRTRWLVPVPVLVALLVVALVAVLASARPRWRAWAPAIGLAMLVAFLASTHSILARPGPAPERLDKLTPDVAGLVEPLGGEEAAPFVLGPSRIHRELPQLMPHLRLPYSLPKFVRKTRPTATAFVEEVAAALDRGTLTAEQLAHVLALYPIDRIVVDEHAGNNTTATLLAAHGWKPIGDSGRYAVWSRP